MEYKGLTLSDFQVEAIEGVKSKENVIVSTHTGNGKTLIADFAVNLCKSEGKQVVYTAPIKALSNQKFLQFKKEFGEDLVGLITGDRVINDTAPILIMTTEILRNMMHEDPERVQNIEYIIFDEIHYLNDEERGTVWEEAIIFKNKDAKIIGLSATIPNIQELCDWIEYIHEEKVLKVFYPDRIVKQKHFYFDKKIGPCSKKQVLNYFYSNGAYIEYRNTHVDFIQYAIKQKILPALFFVFSRRQCEEKASELAQYFDLLNKKEKSQIEEILIKSEEKYPILMDMQSWNTVKSTVINGICYHHAGLIPIIKEVIEELFALKLIKVLYATETFAVGINYPVKTVCFDSHRKFDGKSFRSLTGSEYLQMSGRAGRRGIDDFGFVYTLVDYKYLKDEDLLDLDKVKSDKVISQFRLTYNTVLNLASRYTLEEIQEIFRKSLANYQYIRTINNRNDELNKKRQLLASFSTSQKKKNVCKYSNSDICPIERIKMVEEMKQLINLSRSKKIPRSEQIEIKREIGELQVKLKNIKFKKCGKGQLRDCSTELSESINLKATIKKIEKSLIKLTNNSPEIRFREEYHEKLKLLIELGYITEDNKLLPRGETCSKVHVQELFVTELIYEGLFNELDEDALNAYMAGIIFEDDRPISSQFKQVFDFSKVYKVLNDIQKREEKLDIQLDTTFMEQICPIMYEWSKGCTLDEITSRCDLQEGDFVALCRRVMDLYRQIKNSNKNDSFLIAKINNCISKINRDVVELGL